MRKDGVVAAARWGKTSDPFVTLSSGKQAAVDSFSVQGLGGKGAAISSLRIGDNSIAVFTAQETHSFFDSVTRKACSVAISSPHVTMCHTIPDFARALAMDSAGEMFAYEVNGVITIQSFLHNQVSSNFEGDCSPVKNIAISSKRSRLAFSCEQT